MIRNNNDIFDFNFSPGEFANAIVGVEDSGQPIIGKIKVFAKVDEPDGVWYIVTAPEQNIKKWGLSHPGLTEMHKNYEDKIPENWSLGIVAADELEPTDIQSLVRIKED